MQYSENRAAFIFLILTVLNPATFKGLDKYYNSANFYNAPISCSTGDTCKITIIYPQNSFRAFPTTKLECVTASSDTAAGDDLSCSECSGTDMAHSLSDTDWQETCKLNSVNGLSTAYCSQIDNGNKWNIVTKCYQGSFSAETPIVSTPCKPTSLTNTNSLWCATKWYKESNGNVNAIGYCTTDQNFITFSSPMTSLKIQSCTQNDCNNVLICYVGNWFQIESDDSDNTLKPSLCYATENNVCQMDVSYSRRNGFTLTGSCQAIGSCVQTTPVWNDNPHHQESSEEIDDYKYKQIGTICCTDQYCNEPSQFAFYFNSAQMLSQSIISAILLALVATAF